MWSQVPDYPTASHITSTATDDPFISPDFHLRTRSLSSTSLAPATSTATACSPNVSALQDRRSVLHWPFSKFRFQLSRLRGTPTRWICILLCLMAALLVWRLPSPSTREVAYNLEEQLSLTTLQVLRPRDSAGTRPKDPEQWLRENSEDALARKKRWWKRSSGYCKACAS
jgi:hypothetical protein